LFVLETTVTIIVGISTPNIENKTELIVIFGNTVNEDGSLSERLKARLDVAINHFNNNRDAKLLVSGGFGKEGYYEGDKMKEYLLAEGVNSNMIMVDNDGNNTFLTLEKTKQVADSFGIKNVVFATQFYHKRRVLLASKPFGFKNVSCLSAPYYEWRDLYSLFREFFAIQSYRFK